MRKRATIFPLIGILFLFLVACQQHYSPKPRGYSRIELPDKEYQTFLSGCPFTFDYPAYAHMEPDQTRDARWCWLDMVFPAFNARLHLSYMPVSHRALLDELIEDAYTFAYTHSVRATAIGQQPLSYPQNRVFGVFYDIRGNAASGMQFYLTDSATHYIRGALYFNEQPRTDSIQPVMDFIRQDMEVFVRSLQWK